MPKGKDRSDPRRTTRQEVLKLKIAGYNGNEIALALGVTPQRVSQHVKALREAGLLKPEQVA